MRVWQKITGAIFLTVLFTGVLIADGTQIFKVSVDGDKQYVEALGIPTPKIKLWKKVKDSTGTVTGCEPGGKNCAVVFFGEKVIAITLEGIYVQ